MNIPEPKTFTEVNGLLTASFTSKLLKAFPEHEDMTHINPDVLRWDVSFGRARIILKQKYCWIFQKQKNKEAWTQVSRCEYWQLSPKTDQIIKIVRKIK